MIELDVEQGSTEWQSARLGIPTASQFHRILTPGSLKSSAQAPKYLCEKLAERLLGFPMDSARGGPMLRGSEMEKHAVAWYEFQTDTSTRVSGICLSDDRSIGASVDRFVGDDGILEVKCPLAPQHLENLLRADEEWADHKLQCQGQMWVTGRKWVDLLSFFAELPPALRRVERDERCIETIAEEVSRFCVRLEAAERRVRGMLAGEKAA